MKFSLFLGISASAIAVVACSGTDSTGANATAFVEPTCIKDAGPPPPAHVITITANGTSCAGREFVGALSDDEKTLTIRPKLPAARSDEDAGADASPPRPAPLFDNGI